jgi:hypothetical protein
VDFSHANLVAVRWDGAQLDGARFSGAIGKPNLQTT